MHALEKATLRRHSRHYIRLCVPRASCVYRYYNRECHVPTSLYFFSSHVALARDVTCRAEETG